MDRKVKNTLLIPIYSKQKLALLLSSHLVKRNKSVMENKLRRLAK